MLLCCLYMCICLQRLHAVKGLSEAKADKMVEAAKKLTNVGSWITGMEAMQKVCAGVIHVVPPNILCHCPRGTTCQHERHAMP